MVDMSAISERDTNFNTFAFSSVDNLKEDKPVFFKAALTNTLFFKKNLDLIPDHVIANIGNGYDPLTGKFTAPRDGLYLLDCKATIARNLFAHNMFLVAGDYKYMAYIPWNNILHSYAPDGDRSIKISEMVLLIANQTAQCLLQNLYKEEARVVGVPIAGNPPYTVHTSFTGKLLN